MLRAGADRTVVADTLRQPLEPDQIALLNELLQHSETYNTLAIRLNGGFGELLDFYGGQRDLKDKTLRVLHSCSFVDDPARVFRAVRFAVRFGFRLGKETLTLLKGAVKMALFQRLSGARLGEELRCCSKSREPVGRLLD